MHTALSRETTPIQLFHVLPCCFFPLLPSPSLSLSLPPSLPPSLSLSLTPIIAREAVTASFGAHPSALVALTPYRLRFGFPGMLLTPPPESLG